MNKLQKNRGTVVKRTNDTYVVTCVTNLNDQLRLSYYSFFLLFGGG